jgi:23S rRNA A1618 N6-methylase RlmF
MWDGRQPMIDFIRAIINKASGKHGKQFRHEISIGVGQNVYVMIFGYTEYGVDKVVYFKELRSVAQIITVEEAVDKFIEQYGLNE